MGGGLSELSHEENTDIMIAVMSNTQLHLTATEGYKTTGTSNKFDGTEDWKIGRDAQVFWEEMVMRPIINKEVADVQRRYDAGGLPWEYAVVRREITKYPNYNCLDVLKFGQEDDCSVPDPGEFNWDEDENASELSAHDVMDGTIPEFCADDWVEGQNAALEYGVAADEDAQNHGDGAPNHGDGDLASAWLENMDEEDIDILTEQSNNIRTLREASRLFKDMGGVLGDSLRNTVGTVIHGETKRLAANQRVPEVVTVELMQGIQAEEATFRISRMQHQEKMMLKKEKEAAMRALKEADAKLKKAKKDRRHEEKVAEAIVSAKAFTLTQLGQGKKSGGNLTHQKNRRDVLQRVREVAELSPQQTCHWDFC